jgi:hypothetical protein
MENLKMKTPGSYPWVSRIVEAKKKAGPFLTLPFLFDC